MRFLGLIAAVLLASTSIAAAQTCPGTSSACPPFSTSQLNLGGAIVGPTGVPFVPPNALGTAGQTLTLTNPTTGATTWAPGGGGGVVGPVSTVTGYIPLWNSTTGGALGAGLPVGTLGNSTIIQTGSNGLLTPSILPIATTASLGGIVPDGTTISVNPSTGVASAIGSAATSVTVGTTTVGGGTSGNLLSISGTTLANIATSGTGSVALTTSPVFVTPALGTPSSGVLTNATGYPAAALVGSSLPSGITGSSLTTLAGGAVGTAAYSNLSSMAITGGTIAGVTALGTTGNATIGGYVVNTVATYSAAGSNIGTATPINAAIAIITAGTAGQGVQAPATGAAGAVVKLLNSTAAQIYIYPPSGSATLNGNAAGAPVYLAANEPGDFYCTKPTTCFLN